MKVRVIQDGDRSITFVPVNADFLLLCESHEKRGMLFMRGDDARGKFPQAFK